MTTPMARPRRSKGTTSATMVCDNAISTPPKNPEATLAAISHAKEGAKLQANAATPNKG